MRRFAIATALFLVTMPDVYADTVKLQTIDTSDFIQSTEGSEASLYRLTARGKGPCRIDATIYGEEGKIEESFAFGDRLYGAIQREYRYETPITHTEGYPKALLEKVYTLKSEQGRKILLPDYTLYRSRFDRKLLSTCSGVYPGGR